MKSIKKILIPTDLSDFSFSAVGYAKTLSDLYDAKLVLLHVLDDSPYQDVSAIKGEMEKMLKNSEELAVERMKRYYKENYSDSAGTEFAVSFGNPVEEILKISEKDQIDIIVMAAHGRPDMFVANKDSISAKLIAHSSIPVLPVGESDYGTEGAFGSADILNDFEKMFFN